VAGAGLDTNDRDFGLSRGNARQGVLLGFATIELPYRLRRIDCPLLAETKGTWVGLPTKRQLDRDGRQRTGTYGKPDYSPVLKRRNRDLADRFSAAVVAVVSTAHPDALDGGSAP
jgi:hypothetical protein